MLSRDKNMFVLEPIFLLRILKEDVHLAFALLFELVGVLVPMQLVRCTSQGRSFNHSQPLPHVRLRWTNQKILPPRAIVLTQDQFEHLRFSKKPGTFRWVQSFMS